MWTRFGSVTPLDCFDYYSVPCFDFSQYNPEITLLYQFHAQKALFVIPKNCNVNFWIENDPPKNIIRFGAAILPLG